MAQEVVGHLKEMQNVVAEIKRLAIETKLLRLKKKTIEDKIMEYLHSVEQPGVKFGNLIVLAKENTKRKRLKKKEKEEGAIKVLEEMGIMDGKTALTKILDSMKGEEIISESLQVKEVKEKN